MWFNLLLAIGIASLTYGATIYLDQHPTPSILENESAVTQNLKSGLAVPDFTFIATDGKPRDLSDFKGRVVILNFWASWCAPCVVEFPALLDIAASFDKSDVVLIALSSDSSKEAMQNFLDKLAKTEGEKLKLPNVLIALDEENRVTHDLFQTYRLPETLIIDRGQTLQRKLIGANWDVEEVKKSIAALK